jgi:hypothetical protein
MEGRHGWNSLAMWMFCFGAWPPGTCKRSRETGLLRFEPESRYLKNGSCALPARTIEGQER